MEDEAVVNLYRAARHHRHIRKIVQALNFQVLENLAHGQVQRLVYHDTHGAAFTMFTDIGDAMRKNAFGQAGHCQQEVIPQTVAASGGGGVDSTGHNGWENL